MDVVNVEQAKIAEAAGAVAVMALERIPADIRSESTFHTYISQLQNDFTPLITLGMMEV